MEHFGEPSPLAQVSPIKHALARAARAAVAVGSSSRKSGRSLTAVCYCRLSSLPLFPEIPRRGSSDSGAEVAVVGDRQVAAGLGQVVARLDAERQRAEMLRKVGARRAGGRRLAAQVAAPEVDG